MKSTDEIKRRLDIAKEKISKPKDTAMNTKTNGKHTEKQN